MAHYPTSKNGGRSFPSLANEFFNTDRSLGSSLLDRDVSPFSSELVPGANIIETEKAYSIELAVPGLEKKDFRV